MSNEQNQNNDGGQGSTGASGSLRVEPSHADGDRSGREDQRPRPTGSSSGSRAREVGGTAPSVRHPLSNGHRPGIPTPQIDPDDLLRVFNTGNPAAVWEQAKRLVAAFRAQQLEIARLRFRVNFGTMVCENCDGLKAGPGVVATCFQAKQCHFSNIREGIGSARHLQILDGLLEETS